MKRFLLWPALLLWPLLALAEKPWLLAFPDIAYDSTHAYFSGPQWTAFYAAKVGNLITVPRDSLSSHGLLPSPAAPSNLAYAAPYLFICNEATLIRRDAYGTDTTFVLPPPTSEAVACLNTAGARGVYPANLVESMGPAWGGADIVWFGLTLRDPESSTVTAGIGWYDPAAGLFGRVYSPELAGYQPKWIGIRADTVYTLFHRQVKGKPIRSRLIAFTPQDNSLAEVGLQQEGIPGDAILAMAQWNDTLLIATDCAIAMWTAHNRPVAWHSMAWASNRTNILYLKTFPGGKADAGKAVEFLPLKSNTPTDVMAKIGNWLQVIAPIGIEGYVDPDEWEKHSVLWSQKSWSCGDSLCFVHLKIPHKDDMLETDFTNTMLTYIDRDRNGIKVGFKMAWARLETMAPVMVPIR
jgi:hypothetical protein